MFKKQFIHLLIVTCIDRHIKNDKIHKNYITNSTRTAGQCNGKHYHFFMIFTIFDVSVIACRHDLMFCTFICKAPIVANKSEVHSGRDEAGCQTVQSYTKVSSIKDVHKISAKTDPLLPHPLLSALTQPLSPSPADVRT